MEALCYGKCLLTTKVGAQGLEKYKENFIVADTTDEQISCLIELIKDKNLIKKYEKRAIEISKNFFSEDVVYKELNQKIEEKNWNIL